jgi:hypothetical protein
VKVGIGTERGPWVTALVAAGYEVFAINPTATAVPFLLLAGCFSAAEWRVMTAGVGGANIGAGMLAFVGTAHRRRAHLRRRRAAQPR